MLSRRSSEPPQKHNVLQRDSTQPRRAVRMLSLHKQLDSAKTPTDKTAIQRQIDATDRQIDQLVYELYGLTDEEIRIVEEATIATS